MHLLKWQHQTGAFLFLSFTNLQSWICCVIHRDSKVCSALTHVHHHEMLSVNTIWAEVCWGVISSDPPPRQRVLHNKVNWQQETLVSTDLDRAGVLGVVQQPHGAVAFPVQTPDAAAHQSAQHLLDAPLCGPRRGERSTLYARTHAQLWCRVTLTTCVFWGPTPGRRRGRWRRCAAAVHRLWQAGLRLFGEGRK